MEQEVNFEHDVPPLGAQHEAQEEASYEVTSYDEIPLHELTDQQVTAIVDSGDFAMLHKRTVEVGLVFRTFTNYFERFSPLIAAMRDKMKAPRGSHRRTEVSHGEWLTWSEYCKRYFGVSSRWIEQLLADEHKADEQEQEEVVNNEDIPPTDVEQVETTKPSKKDKQILELSKANDKLKEEIESLGSQMADLLLKSAEAKHRERQEVEAQTDEEIEDDRFGFVTDYFESIADPTSFASELDRIIRHCKMSDHIRTVMTEAEAV